MEREWEIHSPHFLVLSLFPPSLSISYIIICQILSQNVNKTWFQKRSNDHLQVLPNCTPKKLKCPNGVLVSFDIARGCAVSMRVLPATSMEILMTILAKVTGKYKNTGKKQFVADFNITVPGEINANKELLYDKCNHNLSTYVMDMEGPLRYI